MSLGSTIIGINFFSPTFEIILKNNTDQIIILEDCNTTVTHFDPQPDLVPAHEEVTIGINYVCKTETVMGEDNYSYIAS